MIVITIDGFNWETARELYGDLFKIQSIKKISCTVRELTQPISVNATPPGLVTLFSGTETKNLHRNIFRKSFVNGTPIEFIDRKRKPLDLVWSYFNKCKMYEKLFGPNPYANNKEIWKHFDRLKDLGVKFCPSEELCIFNEASKNDYDLFWIHSSIVKGAVFFPGAYEGGRIPSIMPYDEIRKDKNLKREIYRFGIKRYKQVIKYIQEMKPNETIIICSDHGTLTHTPFTPEQIDEIPLIINKKINIDDINYQWDVKKLILDLKNEVR